VKRSPPPASALSARRSARFSASARVSKRTSSISRCESERKTSHPNSIRSKSTKSARRIPPIKRVRLPGVRLTSAEYQPLTPHGCSTGLARYLRHLYQIL